ncbi:MAG: 3-hydroxyacyl-CoA dehydrogenase [Alphaproteobacteria bacterium]|nr:3-hydroxyacyl-CoA dehydrogenase [Alphaproteobacteria bacterium]
MGSGIAQVAATAGHKVCLYDAVPGAAQKGKEGIARSLNRLVEKGRIDEQTSAVMLARISAVEDLASCRSSSLIIEAIVEDLAAKRDLFGQIEGLCADDAILATNTSSLSITAIGADLHRPHRLVGMHFFNPAPVMALVEIVSGLATGRDIADTAYATAEDWAKIPVHAKSTPGFIVNRVARPFYAEGLRVYAEGGTDPATIDSVMRGSGGFRMGPFELMDLIGNDINAAVTRSVWQAFHCDPRYTPSLAQEELVAAGRYGRKSGAGWHAYGADAPAPSAVTAAPAPAPNQVLVEGHLGPAESLVTELERAGIPHARTDSNEVDSAGALVLDDTVLRLTDGRPATELAAELDEGHKLVLFDLAFDYARADRIAVAAADQTDPGAVAAAAGLFQALDKDVSVIDDIPGMIVARTVAMLANEAAEAAYQGVANPAAIDLAMVKGLNYPRGPLDWADRVGIEWICGLLSNLATVYGEDRYRVSPMIRRKTWSRKGFHDDG